MLSFLAWVLVLDLIGKINTISANSGWGIGPGFYKLISVSSETHFVRAILLVLTFTLTAVLFKGSALCQMQESQKVLLKPLLQQGGRKATHDDRNWLCL